MKRVTPRKLRDRRGGSLSPYARRSKRPYRYAGNLMVPYMSMSVAEREEMAKSGNRRPSR